MMTSIEESQIGPEVSEVSFVKKKLEYKKTQKPNLDSYKCQLLLIIREKDLTPE